MNFSSLKDTRDLHRDDRGRKESRTFRLSFRDPRVASIKPLKISDPSGFFLLILQGFELGVKNLLLQAPESIVIKV